MYTIRRKPVESQKLKARTLSIAVETLPDAALFWNSVLLDALLTDSLKLPTKMEQGGVTRASRAAAIVHAAIHDAVNGVERNYLPYLVQDRAPAGASAAVAAATAAHTALSGLYPSQRPAFDAELAKFLRLLPGDPLGAQFGTAVGHALLLARQNDGRQLPDPPYLQKQTLGEWKSDPIEGKQIPLTPGWGGVRPFTLSAGYQFRSVPYPRLNSDDYAVALNEVRNRGRADPPTFPPPEEAVIGNFWSYDDLLGTPVRLYNQHLGQILDQHSFAAPPRDLHVHARLLALVNLAMADAGIACWETKYAYNFWRPIEGIRRASKDSNPKTDPDKDWRPRGRPRGPVPNTTPPFPAYVSGHSSFGTTTFWMLRRFFDRDSIAFTLASEEVPDPRSYASLQQAIEENGQSRIYLGVHWQFDNTRGQTLGQQVADYIWDNFLRPIRR
jgi:membrane-associated phospholipid phosphatase